jgi:hypothetical protein
LTSLFRKEGQEGDFAYVILAQARIQYFPVVIPAKAGIQEDEE